MRTSPTTGTHEKTVALLRFGSRTVAVGSPVCCHSMNRPALAQATIGAILRVIQLTLLTRGGEALPALAPSLLTPTTKVKVAA